jgi:hypothetical protein
LFEEIGDRTAGGEEAGGRARGNRRQRLDPPRVAWFQAAAQGRVQARRVRCGQAGEVGQLRGPQLTEHSGGIGFDGVRLCQ